MDGIDDGGSDQFPGQKVDTHTGVKDFGARNYSGTLKRWYSADSVTAHIYDPQSLNKYAYVRNDPVNFVDPDGRQLKTIRVEVWAPRPGDVWEAGGYFGWGWSYANRSYNIEDNPRGVPNPFQIRVNRERAKALRKLANADQDCLDVLEAIGATIDDLNTILDPDTGVKFANGVNSSDNLWAVMNTQDFSGTTSSTTVGDVFLMGVPPWPSQTRVDGLSAPKTKTNPNGMIYFRNSAIAWYNVIHEGAHQKGTTDWSMKLGLAALYGADVIDIYGPSSQISDKIKEKCN